MINNSMTEGTPTAQLYVGVQVSSGGVYYARKKFKNPPFIWKNKKYPLSLQSNKILKLWERVKKLQGSTSLQTLKMEKGMWGTLKI